MSKKKRKFKAKGKWGPSLPRLEPMDGTQAARRRDISGLGAGLLSGRSKFTRFLRRIFHTKTENQRMRAMRPPAPKKTIKVDVK